MLYTKRGGICFFLLTLPFNRPFLSCPLPHFQNDSSCETIQIKVTLSCMKVDVQVKLIFI